MFLNAHTHNSSDKNPLKVLCLNARDPLVNDSYFCLGLHPYNLTPDFNSDLDLIRSNLSHPRLVGLGETGLDKTCQTPWNLQISAYQAFLELAKTTDYPLILHSVRSHSLCIKLALLIGITQPILIHGFYGSAEEALSLTSAGIYLGFGTSLFSNSKKTLTAFQKIPKQYILLETDDQKTKSIEDIYLQAASLLQMDLESLILQIQANFFRFYGKLNPCRKTG